MKKLISLLAASVLIAGCFAGCGETETSEAETSSSSSQADTDTAEETEEPAEEETTEEVTTEQTEEETETGLSDDSDDTAEITTVPMPEYNPDDVDETDFIGNWECTKMYTEGQMVEDDLYGIPLNVVAQIVVNDDGTGVFGTGIEGSEDASTAFTYEFADKRLNLTMEESIASEDEVMFLYIQDGELVMAVEGENELVYFAKVDELTVMTEDDLMTAMGIDPADLISEDDDTAADDTAADDTVADDDTASSDVSLGQKNALSSAKSYLDISAFSYDGLVEQLEYEGFSHDEALYAADNCGADWNEQAAKSAENYLKVDSMSKSELLDQLLHEKFTQEQAEYGVKSVGY